MWEPDGSVCCLVLKHELDRSEVDAFFAFPSASTDPAAPLCNGAASRIPELLFNSRGQLLSARSGPLRHDPRQEKGA